jgi:hypothetical protein
LAFVVAAVWLIVLNPSARIKQSALSILAAAAVTGFVTTFLSLKESERHDAFVCTMFWQRSNGQVGFVNPPDRPGRMRITLDSSRVFNLAHEAKLAPPRDEFQASVDLLAYMVVRELSSRFRESWSAEVGDIAGAGGFTVVSYQRPRRRGEPKTKISEVVMRTQLGQNYFGRFNEHLQLTVPPGTSIAVRPYDGSTTAVQLRKPNFFEVSITFIPQVGGGDMLAFQPAKFGLSEEQAMSLKAYPILVQVDARFERITSDNPETEYHKAWVDEIIKTLKLGFADP